MQSVHAAWRSATGAVVRGHSMKFQKGQFNVKSKLNLFVVLGLLLAPAHVWASTSAGLPWETPLQAVAASLTGPVALAVSIIAMASTGAILVFGGELSQFAHKTVHLVLAISFLVFGASFMNILFRVSGALV